LKTIGQIIREKRESSGLLLRQVSSHLQVDISFLSKIETGDKRPTKDQIIKLAKLFQVDEKELVVAYLSDRLVYEIREEELASEALQVAEQKIQFLKKSNSIL
jgi:HTH-type transcriptional regulator, competence development regulator